MQVQSGKLYENKTWNYLYPCLKVYGNQLRTFLNSFYKLGVGLKDYNIDIDEGNCIYILLDTKIYSSASQSLQAYRENLSKFLEWVRFQPYYVIDYVFEGFDKGEKHMLVLRLPGSYQRSYNHFLKGRYSKMYTPKEIKELFPTITNSNKDLETRMNTKTSKLRSILSKSAGYIDTFREILNNEFNTNLSREDIKNHELDFPPQIEEETFNYKKDIVCKEIDLMKENQNGL